MTSPRGSGAAGRPAGGDDVTAAPSADAGQAEAVTAAAGPASGAPDQTSANGSSAEAVPASGSPAGTTVRGPSAGLDQQRAYQPGPMWARWLPPVVAFLACLWGITTPSYWRGRGPAIPPLKPPPRAPSAKPPHRRGLPRPPLPLILAE